jgi:hypothetical protein
MTMTDEAVKSLLDGATPGRRVQFHGSYCPEAVGTPFSDWDTSHDVSVIRPDGSRYRLAHYKHASDAYLSQMAPDLARTVIALHAELADAQAAQAMVVERCAEFVERQGTWMQEHNLVGNGYDLVQQGKCLRALAPIDGFALVQELRAGVERLNRWRAEEGEKIKRQAKALTDLTKHCQRIEAENAGLARKIGKVQRGDGDHSQIADLEAKVINQRNELANLRARDGRLAELAVERDTLAAANSMLEAKVAGLRSAFRVNMLRFGPPGTSHEEIDAAIDAALATQEAGNG